uniref:Retrotransposon gag domain-containing protein n=1 Tax=Tanacetum cinerariifolium TaxID=118510 RepID=A0A6L2P794_TANCI|nr:hypothetical protein [Tanacetum cinerariifolium]
MFLNYALMIRQDYDITRAAIRSHQNESLVIAGRNLFDDEASSSNNTGTKLPTPPKSLYEHSRPSPFSFLNPIAFLTEQTGRIVNSRDIWLIQSTCNFHGSKNEDPLRHVKNYLSIVDNIQADGATRDASRLRFFYFSLAGKAAEWLDKLPLTQNITWDQLVSRFLDYFFPDLIKQVPHHGIQKWLLVQIFHDNISRIDRRSLDQFTQIDFDSLTKEERWNRIEEYVWLKKKKKDDDDARVLFIFKQIHINLPFLEAMFHMPKGAKVLKDLLSHKENLRKRPP